MKIKVLVLSLIFALGSLVAINAQEPAKTAKAESTTCAKAAEKKCCDKAKAENATCAKATEKKCCDKAKAENATCAKAAEKKCCDKAKAEKK